MISESRGVFTCRSSTVAVFVDSDPFRGQLSDFLDRRTPGCVDVLFINNHRFVRFSARSWTTTHRFGVPTLFQWLSNPTCAYVMVVKTHCLSRFRPVSWTITQFWGSQVISTIDEPRGAFTCRSSTLTILADSGPFHALLLGVLGSHADFHD